MSPAPCVFGEGHWGGLRKHGRCGVSGCKGQGTSLEFVGDDGDPLCVSPVSLLGCSVYTVGAVPWLSVIHGLSLRGLEGGSPCRDHGGPGEASTEDRTPLRPHSGSLRALLGPWPRGKRSAPLAVFSCFGFR